MNTAEDDADWRAYEREVRDMSRCRCGGDMPGRCPGPAYCPCCETSEEDEEDV